MIPFAGKFVSFFWWILQLYYWTFGWTEQCFCCCRLQDVWCWADSWDKQLGMWCLRRYCWLWGCSCRCSQQLALRQDLDHWDLRQRHWPFWTYHCHFAGGWHRFITIAKFINWNTPAFFKTQNCLFEASSSTWSLVWMHKSGLFRYLVIFVKHMSMCQKVLLRRWTLEWKIKAAKSFSK